MTLADVGTQLKRWLPMFGSAWLALQVLAAQAMSRYIRFFEVMGDPERVRQARLLADAVGLDLHVATAMGTSAAVLVVGGLAVKCWTLWRDWRAGKAVDRVDPARFGGGH